MTSSVDSVYPSRLAYWREQRALAQRPVWEAAGLSRSTYWRPETGEYENSPLRYLVNCAIVFDVELGELPLGRRPLGMTADKALSWNSVFEYDTRRGIASAIPWRKTSGHHDRESWDTEHYDRHGIPRCRYCG
jgi:hypothetical protein